MVVLVGPGRRGKVTLGGARLGAARQAGYVVAGCGLVGRAAAGVVRFAESRLG